MRKHWWRLLAVLAVGLALLPLLSSVAWLLEQRSTWSMLDRYGRLYEGQKRAEVEAILGKPHVARPPTRAWPRTGSAGDVIAEWSNGEVTIVVAFAGGRSVRHKDCSLPRLQRGPLDYLKEQWQRWFP